MLRRFPLLEHPCANAIAHRGGSLEAEENTLPAFAHAVATGFSHVELDVHATRDGVVMVHHDPTLERMTGDTRAVADLNWSELRTIRTHGGAGIPRLEDVLEAHPGLFINIEAKSDRGVDPLAALIGRMNALERIGAGSFRSARTHGLRARLGERLCWSPAHGPVLGLWVRGWGLPMSWAGFGVVQVPEYYRGIPVVTPRFVRAAHRLGVRVQVWTVNDADAMVRLLDMGVDGLMTDRPTVLRAVLERRGEWRGG